MSDHANPAADILPRSVWDGRGSRVRILATAGGYVRYVRLEGPPSMLVHHLAFRREFAPRYNRRAMKSQFSMSCSNLAEFRAYWIGDPERFLARSVACQRAFRIPAGAVEIGVYAHPFNPDAFLADLDCVIATIDNQARRSAAV